MKATINNIEISKNIGIEKVHFVNQEIADNVSIVDYFEDPVNGQLVISLYSELFSENQQKIFIRDNTLVIIVSQIIRTYKSDSAYVSDWQSFGQQSYIRMRNISLMLPGDNFYLLRHFFIPDKLLLKIFMRKLIDN